MRIGQGADLGSGQRAQLGVGQGGDGGRGDGTDRGRRDGGDGGIGQAVNMACRGHGVELGCRQGIGVARREAGDLGIGQAGDLRRGQGGYLRIGQGTDLGRCQCRNLRIREAAACLAVIFGTCYSNGPSYQCSTAKGNSGYFQCTQSSHYSRTTCSSGCNTRFRNGKNRFIHSTNRCVAKCPRGCLCIKQGLRRLAYFGMRCNAKGSTAFFISQVVECHFIRHLLLPRSPIVSAFRRRLFFACEQFLLSSTLRSAVERTLHGYGGTGYVGIANIGLFHFHFLPSGEFLNRLSCCVKEGLADLVARKFSGKVLRNHLPAGSKNSLLMSHLPSARTRLSSLLPASVKLSAR